MIRDRLLLAGLICCAPLALGWLLYREIQWISRRRGFHGTYEQPVEPWGDGGRVPEGEA